GRERLILRDIEVRNAQERPAAGRDADDRGQRLGKVHLSVRRLGGQGTGRDGVGVAPTIEQEILVLHVVELFGVEGHADKMEAGIEAVDLDWILHIVIRRAIAVVIAITGPGSDRKSTRLNSSHSQISYAVFCLKKKK